MAQSLKRALVYKFLLAKRERLVALIQLAKPPQKIRET
jgi:hypothetical protein